VETCQTSQPEKNSVDKRIFSAVHLLIESRARACVPAVIPRNRRHPGIGPFETFDLAGHGIIDDEPFTDRNARKQTCLTPKQFKQRSSSPPS
jgi:hypothetical protein